MNGINSQKFYTKYLLPKNYNIGDYTYGEPTVIDFGEGSTLIIGKFDSIAEEVTIFLGGNHRTDWNTTYPFSAKELNSDWPEASMIKGHPSTKGDVIIGNDVWICRGATILSGVKIGDGSVIGARAVVTKDVPAYSIVAGNPARVVKMRFSFLKRKYLLGLKWWDWPESEIRSKISALCSNKKEIN